MLVSADGNVGVGKLAPTAAGPGYELTILEWKPPAGLALLVGAAVHGLPTLLQALYFVLLTLMVASPAPPPLPPPAQEKIGTPGGEQTTEPPKFSLVCLHLCAPKIVQGAKGEPLWLRDYAGDLEDVLKAHGGNLAVACGKGYVCLLDPVRGSLQPQSDDGLYYSLSLREWQNWTFVVAALRRCGDCSKQQVVVVFPLRYGDQYAMLLQKAKRTTDQRPIVLRWSKMDPFGIQIVSPKEVVK